MSQSDSRKDSETKGFYLAAFGVDGALEGDGYWRHQDLSERWLNLCEELFAVKGQNFDYRWTGSLSKIRTKMTSANGTGICTFFIDKRVASSVLLLRGTEAQSEAQSCRLFVDSLRATPFLKTAGSLAEPFQDVFKIANRPLMIVVPFPDPAISDQDFDLVRELSLHLASAFMCIES